MCGIVGIADLAGTAPVERGVVEAMRDRLAHRGPDDIGCEVLAGGRIGLGHRRLAIIAPTPEGRQPMADTRGELWIVFNGEIYNYCELRDELADQAFATRTDTEVILAAYRAWGIDCVRHLRGMFAFAIFDARHRRLVLARDRLGIKPMYYAEAGGTLQFASEPKALLLQKRAPDPASLLDYLSYGYVPWDRCAFDGIRKLPPASVLVHDERGTQITTYWQPEPTPRLTGEPAAEAVREKLDDAVRAHLIADVPLGAFLSGGVDSSAIVASAARALPDPLRTIAVDFDVGESELPHARAVAERYHTKHVEHRTRADDVIALLDKLAFAYDEPLADTSTVPTYLMCELARRDVTVALSGDGGDELFAGYTWYGIARDRPLPGGRAVEKLVSLVRGLPRLARAQRVLRRAVPDVLERYHHAMCLFDPWELARLAGPRLAPALRGYDPRWLFARHFRRDLPLLTALQLLDLRTFLVDDILVKVDRAGMASSLEVRPPLLDHALVETAFDIAPEAMLADGRGKWPLRRAVQDRLPASVLARAKRGFSAPMSTWFRAGVADAARQRLRTGPLVADGLIEPRFVDWMIDNYRERRWAKLWSLLVLERWYERWVRG